MRGSVSVLRSEVSQSGAHVPAPCFNPLTLLVSRPARGTHTVMAKTALRCTQSSDAATEYIE